MGSLADDDPRQIGSYRILRRLGAGGMGVVYLGQHQSETPVAIKVIHSEAFGVDENARSAAVRRFLREIEATRSVFSPNTVRVVGSGIDRGRYWYATEYIDGPTLQQYMCEHDTLTVAQIVELGLALCTGLAAIHARGLVHRDLKPANILRGTDGAYKIIDFGIVHDPAGISLTDTGRVVGTLGFLAPEQAEGADVTPAADIFNLGLVLAYAATGRSPFQRDNAAAMLLAVTRDEPNLTGVSAHIVRLIRSCLTRSPLVRPTLDAVRRQLENIVAAASDSASQPVSPTQLRGTQPYPRPGATRWVAPPAPTQTPSPGTTPWPPVPRPAPSPSPSSAPRPTLPVSTPAHSGPRWGPIMAPLLAVALAFGTYHAIPDGTFGFDPGKFFGSGTGDSRPDSRADGSTTPAPVTSLAPMNVATPKFEVASKLGVAGESPEWRIAVPHVAITSVETKGYQLLVSFQTSGKVDAYPQANDSCIRIESGGAEHRVYAVNTTYTRPQPYSTPITSHISGTLTFPLLHPGTYQFSYGCNKVFSLVSLGRNAISAIAVTSEPTPFERYSKGSAVILGRQDTAKELVLRIGSVSHLGSNEPSYTCIDGNKKQVRGKVSDLEAQSSPGTSGRMYLATLRFPGVHAGTFHFECNGDFSPVTV